jgi:hypothetical protein
MNQEELKSRAREIAATAWCTENTSHIEMDVDLAEAFADILIGCQCECLRED